MAKLPNGILGAGSGSVGPIILQTWKGKPVMRSQPGPRKKPPSEKQRAQMAKYSTVSAFVHGFGALMRFSFNTNEELITSPNLAYRLNLANALKGEYPNFEIDYPKALVSFGTVLNVIDPVVSRGIDHQILFNWTNNSAQILAYSTDSAVLSAYCPASKTGIFKTAAAHRPDCTAVLDALEFEGNIVHTWISFMSQDGKNISTSVYAGEIDLRAAEQAKESGEKEG